MFRRLGFPLAAAVAATTIPLPTADAAPDAATANAPVAPPGLVSTASAARRTANIAHRGASAAAPENTIAAFKLARTKRAHLFEIDVQQTKDHKLVLMHDTTLARTTNVESVYPFRSPWRVSDFTLAEIRRLDAGSWFGSRYKRERVPTLGETLRAMQSSGLGLLLEIKEPERYPGIERRVAYELRRNPSWLRPDPLERRLIVQSFDFGSARRFNRLLPKVPVGLLGKPSTAQLPALAKWADQINPSYKGLTASYVKSVHRSKMEVFAWTVDDSAKMRITLKTGVDGIITNKPDVLDRVLRKR
ncbi:glycerophosphodiester phosphodiesterase [Spirillospora sp. NPDC048911]|uniref:glycerophosphodiester phosphodiesterase n=1 Tax=Spirillospora sp. NPDC048911 TaxID=3364527 RepID=UPI003714E711